MSTIPEFINLLEMVKSSLRKEKNHVMLMDSSSFKKSSKNKKMSKSTQVEGGVAEKKVKETASTCFYFGQISYWKMNCKAYLESRKEVASDVPFTSGIYVIKVNIVSLENIRVYNTSCGSYIYIDM